MAKENGAVVDYIEVVDPDTLESLDSEVDGPGLVALSAKFGTTRLIDNTVLIPGK